MKGARFTVIINAIKLDLQRTETNAMKRLVKIAIAMMALVLTGCDEGKYPVSGESYGPDDPVQKLDARAGVVPGV
jgi:hypothetical protein